MLVCCFGERKRTELLVIFYSFVQCANKCDAVYYIFRTQNGLRTSLYLYSEKNIFLLLK